MIRIQTTRQALYDLIDAEEPTWQQKAKDRTKTFKALGQYEKGTDFWGDIKNVYIDLQHEKCAYCETKLAGKVLASKVHEVEHFRPKSQVRVWPGKPKKGLTPFVPPCNVGAASDNGYYLLSYNPLNYAIACTRCNSTLKSDYFPIRGKRNIKGSDPIKLKSEDPLLVFPLSDVDTDPSDLIRFDGVLAVPVKSKGKNYQRALITIEFFRLNHEDLTTRRAQIIATLWLNLRTLVEPSLSLSLRQDTQTEIDRATAPSSGFSGCARDYVALYEADRALADKYGKVAQALLGK